MIVIESREKIVYTATAKGRKGKAFVVVTCNRPHIVIETATGHVDWPLYVGGRLLWNWPERVPSYVKALAWSAYDWMTFEFAGNAPRLTDR